MWLASPNMQKKRIAISVDHLQLHRIGLSSKERYLALELNNQSGGQNTKMGKNASLSLCTIEVYATDEIHLVKLSVQASFCSN